jgi:hypothetical protein
LNSTNLISFEVEDQTGVELCNAKIGVSQDIAPVTGFAAVDRAEGGPGSRQPRRGKDGPESMRSLRIKAEIYQVITTGVIARQASGKARPAINALVARAACRDGSPGSPLILEEKVC